MKVIFGLKKTYSIVPSQNIKGRYRFYVRRSKENNCNEDKKKWQQPPRYWLQFNTFQ